MPNLAHAFLSSHTACLKDQQLWFSDTPVFLKGTSFLVFQDTLDGALPCAGNATVLLWREAPGCGGRSQAAVVRAGQARPARSCPGSYNAPAPAWSQTVDTSLKREGDLHTKGIEIHIGAAHQVAIAGKPTFRPLPDPTLKPASTAALWTVLPAPVD